jgi:UDP-glucuronate 4-epimerase
MKSILITGSAGFIGFHLSNKLLTDNYRIVGIDNLNDYYDSTLKKTRNEILKKSKKYTFFKTDVTELNSLEDIFKKHKIDIVCHLAGQASIANSLKDPFSYENANGKGFLNVLESCKKHHVKKLVYASSSSIYGGLPINKNGFREEQCKHRPYSVYGATKLFNEILAYTYHHLYRIKTVGLRFFSAYGPYGRPDMSYFKFAKAISEGTPISLYNYGRSERDFTYIDDIVQGICMAIKKDFSYEIFNIGTSKSITMLKLIRLLEKYLGKKAKVSLLPRNAFDMVKTKADITKARRLLGYKPAVSIEEGMMEFARWYKDQYPLHQ